MAEQEDEKSRHMAFGYCSYSDVQPTHLVSPTQLQGFEPSSEIYSLASGIEMIGFQPKTLFLDKPGPAGFPSASSMVAPHSMSWQENHHSNRPLVGEESSIRCVFPCEGNERPSQGLSLSLSSSNPSTIGLQTFELRHTHQHQGDFRLIAGDGFCVTSAFEEHDQQQQHVVIQEQGQSELGGQFHQLVRSSKYLAPAQELLNEFCCLGISQDRHDYDDPQKQNQKLKQANSKEMWGGEDDPTNNINSNTACGSNSVSRHQQASLYALDLIELQKRKKKLLAMLDELERRYKHYCNQMKAVVGSFEMVAGEGTASPYTVLASKAMSKHFRCLRDGVVAQIKATKAAMGEKDSECGSHGATKGETPRLRILDQTLRQHRALQQMGMVESHPWRPQRGLPERAVSVLRAWLFEHFLHPYPSDVDKHILARQTGLTRSQVSNWFINARVRLWKPMVEEMYIEELKEDEPSDAHVTTGDQGGSNPDPHSITLHDQKPCHDQLLRFESESLSSIVSTSTTRNSMMMRNPSSHHEGFGRVAIEGFGGPMDSLDFSSYGNLHEGNFGIGGSVRGVSLTLGLQQHGGAGLPGPHLLYGKEGMEDAQQYSLLEGGHAHDDQINEPQNLPYMNLQLGAQLLHDFA